MITPLALKKRYLLVFLNIKLHFNWCCYGWPFVPVQFYAFLLRLRKKIFVCVGDIMNSKLKYPINASDPVKKLAANVLSVGLSSATKKFLTRRFFSWYKFLGTFDKWYTSIYQ